MEPSKESGPGRAPSSRISKGGRKLSVTIAHPRKLSKREKGTQTMYRESEAQTLPWSPDVVFRRRGDGSRSTRDLSAPGLYEDDATTMPAAPAGEGSLGVEDVIAIERARQRRAWEDALPRTSSKRNDAIRVSCVTSLAANEVAFREATLDAQREERLKLSSESMKNSKEKMLLKLRARLDNMRRERFEEGSAIMKFWDRQFKRRMRKLNLNYLKFSGKFRRIHSDPGIWTGGCSPDDGSGNADEIDFSKYLAELSGIELLEKQIAVSAQFGFAKSRGSPGWKATTTTTKGRNVCSRALKNAEKQFEMLRDAQGGKQSTTAGEDEDPLRGVPLRKRLRRSLRGMSGEDVRRREDAEEMDQASLLLGKIVKGRAVQSRFLWNLIGRDPFA